MDSSLGDAEYWNRTGWLPVAADAQEGLKYFHIHHFTFTEGDRYSQLPATMGYAKSISPKQWLDLLIAWEEEIVARFSDWNRRADMEIVEQDQTNPKSAIADRRHRDIVRSYKSAYVGNGLSCQEIMTAPGNESSSRRVGFSSYCDLETLLKINIKVQSVAITKPINVRVTHHTQGQMYPHLEIKNARLIIWIETERVGDELIWRFMGSVYSWKHCQMESLDDCDDTSREAMAGLTQPLIRRWAQLIQIAEKASHQASLDKNNPHTTERSSNTQVNQELSDERKRWDYNIQVSAMRRNLARALGEIGPGALASAPTLIEILENEENMSDNGITYALERIGPKVIPLLVTALENESAKVRINIAGVLGRFGPDAVAAVPTLMKMLNEEDVRVRVCAASALLKITKK